PIDRNDQRPLLVPAAKEEILTDLERFNPNFPSQQASAMQPILGSKNPAKKTNQPRMDTNRHQFPEKRGHTDGADHTDDTDVFGLTLRCRLFLSRKTRKSQMLESDY